MTYLTPAQLATVAPAARKLHAPDEGLIDTSVFLRHAGKRGYRPVLAFQGKTHEDSESPSKGRHLVVAATGRTDRAGQAAVFLLNSHTVHRRAWLGLGFVSPAADSFLVGAALPVQRWKGYEPTWAELETYLPGLRKAKEALQRGNADAATITRLAEEFASAAYFPGYKKPDVADLIAGLDGTAWDVLNGILGRVIKGGVLAETKGDRRIKPLRGPDALMLAGCAAHNAGLALLRRQRPPMPLAFPVYRASTHGEPQ